MEQEKTTLYKGVHMRQIQSVRRPGTARKSLIVLILFLLVLKLGFLGYLYAASGKSGFATTSFLAQAIAQEEVPEEMVVARGTVDSDLEQESLSLLNKKRKELDLREEQLKQEEDRLNQLRTDINNILEGLTEKEAGIDKRIKDLITLKETLEEAELKKLAQVFESTPPEQAGPMFDKLDVRLAAKILFRMKGRYAGKIWGYVDPDQAVAISNELSTME
jgi:flagellar motility protein MotE (MotC chaperone)